MLYIFCYSGWIVGGSSTNLDSSFPKQRGNPEGDMVLTWIEFPF